MVKDILKKVADGTPLRENEISSLFRIPLFTDESAMILAASRRKSELASNGLAAMRR